MAEPIELRTLLQLPPAAAVTGTDVVGLQPVGGGPMKKASVAQLADVLSGGDIVAAANAAKADAIAASAAATAAAAKRDIFPCAASGTANAIILNLKPGYTLPAGSEFRFGWFATATNTGTVIVTVVPVTGTDPRQIRLPGDLLQVPPGAIRAGAYCEIVYLASGRWELVTPQITLATEIPLVQTNLSPVNIQAKIAENVFPHPAASLRYWLEAIGPRGDAGLGVTLEIADFNPGDPRGVVRPGDLGVEAGAYVATNRLGFDLLPSGNFLLAEPLPLAATMGASEYSQIRALRFADSAARGN